MPPITTRFLVLSQGRSGSTLLVDELNRRWKEIRCKREMFRAEKRSPERTFETIKREIFFEETGQTIVGCKIFAGHLTSEEWSDLLAMDGLRVIILRRRNLLRRYISDMIAHRTSLWAQHVDQDTGAALTVDDRRVSLDVGDLHLITSISLRAYQDFKRLTADLPRMDVWYEDLAEDLDGQLRRLATFLGAGEPAVETPPKLTKQNPEPIRELVVNLDEVAAYLREVGLADLLEEGDAQAGAGASGSETGTGLPCWPTGSQVSLLRTFFGPAEAFESRWRNWLEVTPLWDREMEMEGLQSLADFHLRPRRDRAAILHDFRWDSMTNAALKLHLFESLRDVTGELSNDGFEVILLGPTALLGQSAGRHGTGFRTLTMTGLDLTTRPDQFERVSAALDGLGWISTMGDGNQQANHPDQMVTMHRGTLEIRLHRNMLPAMISTDSDVQARFEHSLRSVLIPAPQLEGHATMPASSELLFTLIVDGLLARPARSIEWILDSRHVISEAGQVLDWNRVAELTSETQLAAPMSAALHLLSELDENLIPPTVLRMIDDLPVTDLQRTSFEELMRTP